ncbi:DUF1049 domain-containing protein [Aliidiomarina taiwanensis]|uniref:DUF1049 domain-containing protein n=1 Tax=Aliidiomarina taiwanensis TaxID=946228 RepID=A0A432X9X8_9GAMM|nr:lipopolysaccharide assembly protein LapA domain-containing protein [Aliidiomarina taiwanensis]RUO44041.1 DUF1049 domain-containing protein [Aliidiomarina taiwanensis]
MARFILSLIPLVIFFLLALAIGSQNQQPVVINLLLAKPEMMLSTLLAWTLGIGFVFGLGVFLANHFSLRIRYRRIRKELAQRIKQGE